MTVSDLAQSALAAVLAACLTTPARAALATDATLPPAAPLVFATTSDAAALGVEAYTYAYPLVLMELTRRVETNVGPGAPTPPPGALAAPMNEFAHQRALPHALSLGAGQRPNADVLMSSLWFDVGREPLVITIPDAAGRWYTMPMFDLWSDVFAAPGPRTSGGGAQRWAVTAPGWTGPLPTGVGRIDAPTPTGRIVARIRTDGAADYPAVHAFQDGLRAAPLHALDRAETPAPGTYDAALSKQSPADRLLRLSTGEFFGLFGRVTAQNPPHAHDWPILQRLARIGIVPGRPFVAETLAPDLRGALESIPTQGGQALFESFKRSGSRLNGWRFLLTPMGTYGTDYRRRQVVAFSAFGADLSEDVLYATTIAAGDGLPLVSDRRYTIHFPATALPPVNAFWSVTVYDDRQMLPPSKHGRVTIGDRDALTKNADGSLDLWLQTAHPGAEKAANWLPLPMEGRLTLMLRLYWPKTAALDGTWQPPPVTRLE